MSHPPSRAARLVTAVVLTLVAARGEALAQACLAIPTLGGEGFLMGSAAFTDGAWAPGVTLGYDSDGPLTVAGEFSYSLADNSDIAVASIGGLAAAEIPQQSFSLCPVASLSYVWLANDGGFSDVDVDGIVIGGGLAVGKRIESSADFAFIPALSGQVVHARASASIGGFSGTGSETFGAFQGAFMLDLDGFFFGPAISITTQDGSDPVFIVRLGTTL